MVEAPQLPLMLSNHSAVLEGLQRHTVLLCHRPRPRLEFETSPEFENSTLLVLMGKLETTPPSYNVDFGTLLAEKDSKPTLLADLLKFEFAGKKMITHRRESYQVRLFPRNYYQFTAS